MLLSLLVAACDAGPRDPERHVGPPVRLLGANVGPDRPMPADGVVQLAFDRYLLPSTVVRQSVVLADANGEPVTGADAPLVTYDPIARTVTLSSPKAPAAPWLLEGQPYKVALRLPTNDDTNEEGLRAIDRAALDPNQPLEIGFFVGPPSGAASHEPGVQFCADVLPLLKQRCAGCHYAGAGAAGLALDSATSVARTALNRIAQGANTGGRSSGTDETGKVFGIDMRIVEPGNPGRSWLLYKVELARAPVVEAGVTAPLLCANAEAAPARDYQPLAPAQPWPADAERSVLGDHVLGREMPYPASPLASPIEQPLTFHERQRLRMWIAQGAKVSECGECRPAE